MILLVFFPKTISIDNYLILTWRFSTCTYFTPQLVLTGGAIIAGEYEVSLLGIYGDDLPLPEANRELLPLLQRLIRLLQEGMPVLMNSAGQVVGGGYSVLGGGAKFDVVSPSAVKERGTSVGMFANYYSYQLPNKRILQSICIIQVVFPSLVCQRC